MKKLSIDKTVNESAYKVNKVLLVPIRLTVCYIVFTVAVFLFGPINWNENSDIYTIIGITLIILYPIAFYFGYRIIISKPIRLTNNYILYKEKRNKEIAFKFLKYAIVINLIVTCLNAFEYTSTYNVVQLLNSALTSFSDLSGAYYEKDVSSRSSSFLLYITLFFEPLLYLTKVNSLIYFKKLKNYQKALVCVTLLVEVLRWISIGTNKGLMDILILLFAVFFILTLHNNLKNKKININKKKLMIMCFLCIIFLAFFSKAISSRINGVYTDEYFIKFPYCYVPENLRVFVERFTSYLTQGYSNMIACIRYGEWIPTFGFGYSRFLMTIMYSLTGINIFTVTYPAQIENYGIDAYAQWHSAYTWFANDISYLGVIFLMFIIGAFFSIVAKKAVIELDVVYCALFYLMLLEIINISCTNYVLAYSNTFVAFWGLFFLAFIKDRIRIKWK